MLDIYTHPNTIHKDTIERYVNNLRPHILNYFKDHPDTTLFNKSPTHERNFGIFEVNSPDVENEDPYELIRRLIGIHFPVMSNQEGIHEDISRILHKGRHNALTHILNNLHHTLPLDFNHLLHANAQMMFDNILNNKLHKYPGDYEYPSQIIMPALYPNLVERYQSNATFSPEHFVRNLHTYLPEEHEKNEFYRGLLQTELAHRMALNSFSQLYKPKEYPPKNSIEEDLIRSKPSIAGGTKETQDIDPQLDVLQEILQHMRNLPEHKDLPNTTNLNLKQNTKRTRSIFIYSEALNKENKEQFGQCSTCIHKFPDKKLCELFDVNTVVYPNSSCNEYIEGSPSAIECKNLISSEAAGLVHNNVRCENCISFNFNTKKPQASFCKLYEKLNQSMPEIFDLDIHVKPHGCCTAQNPKEQVISLSLFKYYKPSLFKRRR